MAQNFKIFLVAISLALLPMFVLGQGSDGSVPPVTPSTEEKPSPTPMEAIATPIATVGATPSPKVTPSPTVSPSASIMVSPSIVVSPLNSPPPSGPSSNAIWWIIINSVIGVAILGGVGFAWIKKHQKDHEGDKCENIKDLLEQKKRELQLLSQQWPQEKLQEFATDKALAQFGRNETVSRVVNAAREAKERYDQLQETIEVLEKRYNLCMLSVPSIGKENYKGTIIENSLQDKEILKNITITNNYKAADWSLNDVMVNEKQIEKMGEYLSDGPWYMDFWKENGDEGIIVFKDKTFHIMASDKNTWKGAIEYGKFKGIPDKQLDFNKKQ